MKTQKTGRAQDTLIYMMFRRHFDVSTKFTDIMSNHQTSSNLPRNSSKNTSNFTKFHPPCGPAVEKVQVIETFTSAKPWSAAGRSAVTEEPLTLRPRPSEPPKTYIPWATSHHTDVCISRAVGVPLGDSWLQRLASQKWPDSCSAKIELATWPQFTQILVFSNFLPFPSSLRWVEMHLAMKRLQTQSQPQKCQSVLGLWKLCLRCRWMLNSVLQIWAGGNGRSNYILTLIKENHEKMQLSKMSFS